MAVAVRHFSLFLCLFIAGALAADGDLPLPSMPKQFSFSEEYVFMENRSVNYVNIWYDSETMLTRIDYAGRTSKDATSEIHDYSTGVKYVIDTTLGNCTISAITNSTFDELNNFTSPSGFRVRMKTPNEIFLLDQPDSFVYRGQKQFRGVVVDYWEGITRSIPGSNGTVDNPITIYFFSDMYTETPNTGDTGLGVEKPTAVVAGIEINIAKQNVDILAHIFNWNPSVDTAVFDVATCYKEESSKHILIKFPIDYKPEYEGLKSFLVGQIRFELSEVMEVSPLRIGNPEMRYNGSEAQFIATLTDRAPPMAQFTAYPKKQLMMEDDSDIIEAFFPEDCADICITNPDFICNSFDYCEEYGTCQLSKRHISDGQVLFVDNVTCTHYSRNIDGNLPEPELADVYEWIKQIVDSDTGLTVSAPFVSGDDVDFVELKASSVRDDIVRNTVTVKIKEVGNTFSAGVLAAVALVMLVVGVVIGIAFFFLLARRRPSNHDDGMTAQYSKEQQ